MRAANVLLTVRLSGSAGPKGKGLRLAISDRVAKGVPEGTRKVREYCPRPAPLPADRDGAEAPYERHRADFRGRRKAVPAAKLRPSDQGRRKGMDIFVENLLTLRPASRSLARA